MKPQLPLINERIHNYEAQSLLRTLSLPAGEDFSSNDYLGFATDARLQARVQKSIEATPSGSTGSRLLRGHSRWAEELENKLAEFSQREAALFLPSGYQANLALLAAVLTPDFIVYSDELNHASIIDGIKLSGCEKKIFKHNDLADLRRCLSEGTSKKYKVIVVERIYSMSGDHSPLEALIELAHEFSAQLIVDEAHSTGVELPLAQVYSDSSVILATMHSAGKALGVSGAWIACDQELKKYLIQFSRPFIYSTAPSPLVMRALVASIEYHQEIAEARVAALKEKIQFFKEEVNFRIPSLPLLGEGPIFFIVLGASQKSLEVAAKLQSRGFDIRAIRYPTVQEHQAGLRISIHANQSEISIRNMIQSLSKEFKQ